MSELKKTITVVDRTAKESQLTGLVQEYTDKERIAKAELQIAKAEANKQAQTINVSK